MRLSIFTIFLSVFFFISLPEIHACNPDNVQWTGNVDSDWENSANYNTPPANGDLIIINPANYSGAGADPVISTASSFNPSEVQVQNGANFTIQGDLSFEEFFFRGGEFLITDNTTTVSISNGATIDIQYFGNKRDLLVENNAQVNISNGIIKCRDYSNSGTTVFNGGELRLTGDLINNGSFSNPVGTIVLEGTQAQDITGSATLANITLNNGSGASLATGVFNLTGALTLTNGTFSTNNALTLISNSSGTARIAEITGGAISGDITMQRYINSGSTNWRFLTSPLSGKTLADWNDDFTTSGFTGSDAPSFPFTSIYSYDESVTGLKENGYVPASSTADPINAGEGYWVWCGDTITGTQPFTIDVTGPANTGTINLPVSYNSSGGITEDGWCMVGNPYPSTIDWDAAGWTKSNINNAIYVWDPNAQQFASYVGGLGTNGGSNLIASSQAFWVQTNAASPQLTATESVKSPTDQPFFKKTFNNILKLYIVGNGLSDEAIIKVNENASQNFDKKYDAYKFFTSGNQAPSISSLLKGNEYSINSIPEISTTLNIPIRTIVKQSGSYNINASFKATDFQGSCLVLEDSYNGNTYNLNDSSSLSFNISDTTTAPRFILHITPPVNRETIPVSCSGRNDGTIIAGGNGTGPWQINLKDQSGTLIYSNSGATSLDTIKGLSPGKYELEVSGNSYCGVIKDSVKITQPPVVIAGFSINKDTVYLSNTGTVTLKNQSANANNYKWDFGDGNTSTAQNPIHSYQNVGSYIISLHASQTANCKDSSYKAIEVLDKPLSVEKEGKETDSFVEIHSEQNNKIRVKTNLTPGKHNYDLFVKNALGQLVMQESNIINSNINKTYSIDASPGILFVTVSIDGEPYTEKIPVVK